jgi:hypothetical protein
MAATATHDHPVTLPEAKVDVSRVRMMSIAAAVIGFAVYLIGGFVGYGADPDHGIRDFFLAYLCGFVFWFCVPFGSLGLSMIGFLASASWGIVFRRVFQASIRTMPVMLVLGLPVIASLYAFKGDQSPFWWSASIWNGVTQQDKDNLGDNKHHYEDDVQRYKNQGWKDKDAHNQDNDKIAEIAAYQHSKPLGVEESLHKIHDWLSPNFFAVRYFVYFTILGTIALVLMKHARRLEDHDDRSAITRLRTISGPCLPVFVLTLTLFVTDWVMSVEPTWASSMFPVIFGMNMFLTTLTFSTLIFYTLTRVPGDTGTEANRPDLTAIIKDKFRIDIGSLTLGFCMVWSYGSFCQFMLVWAGNLPEEITYYLKRGGGEYFNTGDPATSTHPTGWIYLSYVLMACHWLIPFITLLFREVKTSPKAMRFMAVFLLTVCACDVCWWIMPCVPHEKTWAHLPMAFGAILGVGGLWGIFFTRELAKRPILVTNSEGKFLATWGHH